MIQLGFDIDVLEVHLRELYDVVDYFFILESTRSHFKLLKKPLMWEKVSRQERFKIFSEKVIHLIVDDAEATSEENHSIWYLEFKQEKRRWEKFLEWNQKTKYFSDDDVIGFGDADEVASRLNVHLLKYCEIEGPVDIGIWYPLGLLDQAYKPDFPLPGHEFTLADPAYWPLKSAKNGNHEYPSRTRGKAGRYLLGGIHMTTPRYLPFLIMKYVTCTECDSKISIARLSQFVISKNVLEMEMTWGEEASNPLREYLRIFKISDVEPKLLENIVHIPWFLDCNRDRYPYWDGKHDTRLD